MILFAHAISGCDTTAAFYGKGKASCFNVLMKHNHLQLEVVEIFNSPASEEEEIFQAACKYVLVLYGAKKTVKSLNEHRFRVFVESVAKNTQPVDIEKFFSLLPPTEEAVRQQAYRAYEQVQRWKNNVLSPTEWGWAIQNGSLVPVTTTADPAPASLLKLISCKCLKGCMSACSCRKAGIYMH